MVTAVMWLQYPCGGSGNYAGEEKGIRIWGQGIILLGIETKSKELQDSDEMHSLVTNDSELLLTPSPERYPGAESCSGWYQRMDQQGLSGTVPLAQSHHKLFVLQQVVSVLIAPGWPPQFWFSLWKIIHQSCSNCSCYRSQVLSCEAKKPL